jgi:hypothetical protein
MRRPVLAPATARPPASTPTPACRPAHALACKLSCLATAHSPLPAAATKLNWVHGKRIANINACFGDTVSFAWARGAQHDLLETRVGGGPRHCSSGGRLQ